MRLRKNWFYYLACTICLVLVFYAIAVTVLQLGDGQEYPYLLQGELLIGLTAGGLVLMLLLCLFARLRLGEKISGRRHLAAWTEWGTVLLILLVSLLIRIHYIRTMPMDPESDFKTYVEIARYLEKGTLLTEAPGYCDYISIFPHVIGYPRFLRLLFRLTGTSVLAAECCNAVLYTLGVFFLWRTVRMITGRAGAIAAAAIAAFWPSTILYGNFAASEYLFCFLLLACIWLFTLTLKDTPFKQKHPWTVTIELALLGTLIAVTSTVRPMAQIFLIAAILCMLHGRVKLPVKDKNDIPLGFRASDRGYKRCITVLIFYMIFNSIFTASTSYQIDRELAGGSSSFGYNLLVGLNTDSFGGWNDDDSKYLYDALESTGSAVGAQNACRDLAFQRLKEDPKKLLNLFVHKFQVLWGNDDYGASWNILFMDQQGNLTKERESFLYRMMDVSDLYYAAVLVLVLAETLFALRKEADARYAVILMFLGTAALHLLVENQNRYHFHALVLFAILAGCAIEDLCEVCRQKVMRSELQKRAEREADESRRRKLLQIEEENTEFEKRRAEALHAQFDMASAIRDGHIRIIASDSVRKDYEAGKPEETETDRENPHTV